MAVEHLLHSLDHVRFHLADLLRAPSGSVGPCRESTACFLAVRRGSGDWAQQSYDLEIQRGSDTVSNIFNINATDSIYVPCPDTPLESAESARVRVKARGLEGQPSTDWSDWSSVETGLLNGLDWSDAVPIAKIGRSQTRLYLYLAVGQNYRRFRSKSRRLASSKCFWRGWYQHHPTPSLCLYRRLIYAI